MGVFFLKKSMALKIKINTSGSERKEKIFWPRKLSKKSLALMIKVVL